MVSNELGLGIVPGDADTRRFRMLAGEVNQQVAEEADEVHLVVSGLALRLK
jgi:adenosylcobinamide kinase/adenosylcobinamide-phosphate guanylyltransferase